MEELKSIASNSPTARPASPDPRAENMSKKSRPTNFVKIMTVRGVVTYVSPVEARILSLDLSLLKFLISWFSGAVEGGSHASLAAEKWA